MWLNLKKTKEFIPVNEQMTQKVFLDGNNGWCILQKDGKKYHISQEERDALDQEIDRDAYWARRQVEDAAKQLNEEELKKIREILKKGKKEKDED